MLVCAVVASTQATLPENHRASHRPRSRLIPPRTAARSSTTSTTTTEVPIVSSTTAAPSTIVSPTDVDASTASPTSQSADASNAKSVEVAQISQQVIAQQYQQQLALQALQASVKSTPTLSPYMQPGKFQPASKDDIQQLIQLMQGNKFNQDGQFSYQSPTSYNPQNFATPSSGASYYGQQPGTQNLYNSLQYQQPNTQLAQQSVIPQGMYQHQLYSSNHHQGGYNQQNNFQPHVPLQQFLQQYPSLPYGAPLPYNPPDTPTYVFRDGKYHIQPGGVDPEPGRRVPLAINDTPLTVDSTIDIPGEPQYFQAGQGVPSPVQAQHAFAKLAQEQVKNSLAQMAQTLPQLPAVPLSVDQQQQPFAQPAQQIHQPQPYIQQTPHQQSVFSPVKQDSLSQSVSHQSHSTHQHQTGPQATVSQPIVVQPSQEQVFHEQPSYSPSAQSKDLGDEPSSTLEAPKPSSFQPSQLIAYQSYVSHPTSVPEHTQTQAHSEQISSQHLAQKQVTAEQIHQRLPVDYEQHPKVVHQVKSPFRKSPQWSEDVVRMEVDSKNAAKPKPDRLSFLSQLFRSRS